MTHIDYSSAEIGSRPTFAACTPTFLVAPAGTKSFAIIMGSATKTIVVTKIHLTGLTSSARAYHAVVARRISSAPSGGTSTSLVQTPFDNALNGGTSSNILAYTVEPTTDGTLVGTLQCQRTLVQDATPVQGDPQTEMQFDFKSHQESAGIVLRGINEGVSLAFGTTPASAISLSIEIEWIEL